jgi:hypothetical protein
MKSKHLKKFSSSFCFCTCNLVYASEIYLRRSILATNGKDLSSVAIKICAVVTEKCKGRKKKGALQDGTLKIYIT